MSWETPAFESSDRRSEGNAPTTTSAAPRDPDALHAALAKAGGGKPEIGLVRGVEELAVSVELNSGAARRCHRCLPLRHDWIMSVQRAGAARTLVGVDVGSTHIKAALVAPGKWRAARGAAGHRDSCRPRWRRISPSERAAGRSELSDCRVRGCSRRAPQARGRRHRQHGPIRRPHRSPKPARGRHPGVARSAPERQAAWLERQIGAAPLFARTGLRPEPKYTLSKLLWLREHKAADFTRLRHWAGVAELVALDLTGNLATNASLACRTLAFNVTARAWDAELLALASLGPDEMPVVLPLGKAVGGLTAAAATRLGFAGRTPVAIAGHDHLAAALGAGVTKPGDVLDSMGSAEATLLVAERPALADENQARRLLDRLPCRGRAVLCVRRVAVVRRADRLVPGHIPGVGDAAAGADRAGEPVQVGGASSDEAERYAPFVELLEGPVRVRSRPIVRPYLRAGPRPIAIRRRASSSRACARPTLSWIWLRPLSTAARITCGGCSTSLPVSPARRSTASSSPAAEREIDVGLSPRRHWDPVGSRSSGPRRRLRSVRPWWRAWPAAFTGPWKKP